MTRLTSAQIISLNIMNNEISGDDSCDESEIDNVESHLTASMDNESIDNGVDDCDINDDEMLFRVPNLIQSNVSNVMSKSNTIEMISSNIQSLNISIHGRVIKILHNRLNGTNIRIKIFKMTLSSMLVLFRLCKI
jgi:hypothetical protein